MTDMEGTRAAGRRETSAPHWIEAWRRRHGVSREGLAQRVHRIGGGCSPALIELLEEAEGFVTHPKIAARIAIVTGATAAQWDGIVPKQYRGHWTPERVSARDRRRAAEYDAQERARREAEARAAELRAQQAETRRVRMSNKARPVVMLGANGTELRRYASVADAAKDKSVAPDFVGRRCRHVVSAKNELRYYEYTFRFADEWDKMPRYERDAEIKRAGGIIKDAQA